MIYLSQVMCNAYKIIMFHMYFIIIIDYAFIFSVIEIPVYDCSSTASEGILNICYLYFCISPLKFLSIYLFTYFLTFQIVFCLFVLFHANLNQCSCILSKFYISKYSELNYFESKSVLALSLLNLWGISILSIIYLPN